MAGEIPQQARRLAAAGDACRAREDYQGARDYYLGALAILERGPSWWHSPLAKFRWARAIADGLTVLGEIDAAAARPDLARGSLEEALRRYDDLAHHDSEDVAIVLADLGAVYERLGLLADSERALLEALAIGERIGRDPRPIATVLNNLALTLQAAGRPEEAAAMLDRALALPGLPAETRRDLHDERAFHLVTEGRLSDALKLLTEQFQDAEKDTIRAAHLAGNLAGTYAELQDLAEAQRWHRREVAIRRLRQPGSLSLAIALQSLANSLDSTGDRDESGRLSEEALGLAAGIAPHSAELALVHTAKVWRLIEADDAPAAAALGARALAAVPEGGRRLTGLRLAVAAAYLAQERTREARAMLEAARDACEAVSPLLPELRWVQSGLGQLLLAEGAVDEAAHSFDRAIAVAETMRPGSADEPHLGLLFGTARSAYHGRIEAAWRRGGPREAAIAFHAAESFRARMLAEMLSTAGRTRAPSAEAVELLGELDATRQRLGALYRRIEERPGPGQRADRDALEEKAEFLRVRLRVVDPRVADRDSPSPCTVDEVQSCLDESVTVAVYEVTDDGVYLFAVRKRSFAFTRLEPDADALAAAVDEVVAACHDGESEPPADALRRLGEWLLRPIADRLGNLAVCAGGALARLPFEALEIDGQVLAARSAVWSVPSATILTHFGADRDDRRPERPFAGFAMPETPGQTNLPASAREVERAAALLGGEPPLVGAEVTVASVRERVRGARYVHFAVHGLITDERPLYSAFPLAGGEFLNAYEMADLDLCADLVVCSACETAKGEARAGEGTVGLAYSLFAAGARAVLVSRWPIADPVGPRMARALYRRLRDGLPVAEAARGAALELREDQDHPWVWAAFELIDLGAGRTGT